MPVLKSAIKKLRVDGRKRILNKMVRSKAVRVLDEARKKKAPELLGAAFSALDRAAKRGVFHKKKADRLKSRLSRLISRVS